MVAILKTSNKRVKKLNSFPDEFGTEVAFRTAGTLTARLLIIVRESLTPIAHF